MIQLTFRRQPALSALLFVVNELCKRGVKADFIKVFKVLYFADQSHLVKYGRSITGDTYVAMNRGPVPSRLYDIIKAVRDDNFFYEEGANYKKMFVVEDKYVLCPQATPDMKQLSATDVRELNKSLDQYAMVDSSELSEKSHGFAWCHTERDRYMDAANIMREAGASSEMIDHVEEMQMLEKCLNNGVPASC